MKVTEALKKELANWLDTYWTTYLKGDIAKWATFIRDDYRNIGGTKEEIWNSKQEIIDYTNSVMDQMLGTVEIRNREIDLIPYGEYIMVNEFTDLYVKVEGEWNFYGPFRMSSLLEKTDSGWIALHQHGSYPDMKAMEGEAFSIDALKAENAKLQAAVKSRTHELEQNNRELEIEAATERVRVQSMAMQEPGDLEKVNKELLHQLNKLKITGLAGVSFYFVDPNKIVTVWDLSSPGNMNDPNSYSFRFDSKNNPVLGEFVGILKSTQDDYFILDFPKDRLLQAIEELKDIDLKIYNNFKHAVETGALQHQWNPAARITDGILSVDLMMPPTEDTKAIVLKMAGAFNQAYIRFLDLQKAEAQAREAQIETALERVRSRSMAMHSSQELNEVALELRKQMGLLGQKDLEVCAIHLYDDVDSFESWSVMKAPESDVEIIQTQARFSKKGIRIVDELLQHYVNGTKDYVLVNEGEKMTEWFEALQKHAPELHASIMHSIGELPLGNLKANWSVADFSGGALVMVTYGEPDIQSRNLLRRSANVFEQAYIRFLDLQKAEAQALRAEQDLIEIKVARKKAEEALSELQQTQKQLIQSEKMASLGELTAGIAHEIQNPLNFVNNFSEVSNELISEMVDEVDKGNTEEVKAIAKVLQQNLEKILQHGKRADAIVKGMLQHSRSSTGQKEPTDINKLVDEYLRLAYHGLRAKDKSFNATMVTDYDETLSADEAGIGNINIIPQDIGRVILNLITNAFYAAPLPPEGGFKDPSYKHDPTVWIKTSKIPPSGGGGAVISVRDNGPGIPQKILDKIFQPFFTTKPTGQGTGLGLSLSYDIVKAHGGEIKVNTKENEGTEFIIELPVNN